MTDRFDVVSVRIEYERPEVVLVIDGTRTRGPMILAPGAQSRS
jgi:hypothetical protein